MLKSTVCADCWMVCGVISQVAIWIVEDDLSSQRRTEVLCEQKGTFHRLCSHLQNERFCLHR